MDGLTWIAFYSITLQPSSSLSILALFVLEVICSYFTWTYATRNFTLTYNAWFSLQIVTTFAIQAYRDTPSVKQMLAIKATLSSLYLTIVILAYIIILHENKNPLNAELIVVLIIYPFVLIIHLIEFK